MGMKRFAIIVASLLVVACSSANKTAQVNSSQPASSWAGGSLVPQVSQASSPAAQGSTAKSDAVASSAVAAALGNNGYYFDYNRFSVKSKYRADIKKEAAFIKAHKNDVVTLEGNADERGSAEYNLNLGSKRAKAVAKNLRNLGVPASQIKIVSFGAEKPRLTCHEEKCWKENRRVDFVHSAMPRK
jgi:peptidoglycan-associated lipoprotein